MKRTAILIVAAAAFAMPAFAATTSPPTVDKGVILSKQSLVIGDNGARENPVLKKSTLSGSMPVVKKQGDGLGVPVMRVDSVISTVDYIVARETWDDITGQQKKMGGSMGDSKAGIFYIKFYLKGNNGPRAAPAASMGKFDDMSMSAVRPDGNNYIGKVIGRSPNSLPS